MKKIFFSALAALFVFTCCNSTNESDKSGNASREQVRENIMTDEEVSPQDRVPMTIGLVADPQYSDTDTRGPRYYRSPLKKMPECISTFNEEKVDMVVCLGDIVDRDPAELDRILPLIRQSQAPVYFVLGNHDFKKLKDIPNHLIKLGMPSLYYSFSKNGWKFIFLDTNDIANYAQMTPEKQVEYDAMMAEVLKKGTPNAQNWNGGVGSVQMEWLRKQLDAAEKEGENVIVFAHHPVSPMTNHTLLNDREVLDLLVSHKCVRAYINGHYHPGYFAVYEGLPCITLEAMLEGGERNSFAKLTLTDRQILFKGYGRVASHVIDFK